MKQKRISEKQRSHQPLAPGALAPSFWLVMALCLLGSCSAPRGGLAILDPAMAALYPQATKLYRKAAGRLTILPAQGATQGAPLGAQAALYATLDELDPDWLILSPLMATELDKLRATRPDTALLICGPYAIAGGKGVYASVFRDQDAATLAASFLAGRPEDGGLCLGLFSGRGAQAEADAFMAAWESSANGGQAITRLVPEGYSEELARELRSLDISSAFVLAPAKEAARWAQSAFDESAFVALAAPFGLDAGYGGADALVAWDLETALSDLVRAYRASKRGPARPESAEIEEKSTKSAPWKIVLSR